MGGSSRRRCGKPRTLEITKAQRAERPLPEVGVWGELPAEERARLSNLALTEPEGMMRLPPETRKNVAATLLENAKSEPEIAMAWKLLASLD